MPEMNKKYLKIGAAGLAVTALVIGLSVGLTQKNSSAKSSAASSASSNQSALSDIDNCDESYVMSKSGKSSGGTGASGGSKSGKSSGGTMPTVSLLMPINSTMPTNSTTTTTGSTTTTTTGSTTTGSTMPPGTKSSKSEGASKSSKSEGASKSSKSEGADSSACANLVDICNVSNVGMSKSGKSSGGTGVSGGSKSGKSSGGTMPTGGGSMPTGTMPTGTKSSKSEGATKSSKSEGGSKSSKSEGGAAALPSVCFPSVENPNTPDFCICEDQDWTFDGTICIRGCDVFGQGAFDSGEECCEDNGGIDGCTIVDTCVDATPAPNDFSFNILNPTPNPTSGSTPTVSTEVTGPPTKARRPTLSPNVSP